ncbi:hypothetical protein DPMN_014637 [Dreissena polymorpha]|uniref:Uncharacterized protein n=1 Tax=Dreissena polymorpha TaxID=45954 RepID=A0A9D4S5E7_DREPO|nr:hypothetical protein DPMN_014637 [Dreissena polymorpha]
MRNSYINPIKYHTCGETVKSFINSGFAAILVAGYVQSTENVFKQDIIQFNEVVTSKVLPVMCLSPENVIVVPEMVSATNNSVIEQLNRAFKSLSNKKINTLMFVYSGHNDPKKDLYW